MYRILITDDEKTERDCIRFLIQQTQLSLEIQDAEDGLSALHILKDWPADILFTDVQMPVMDGLELIHTALSLLPNLKPVIFSGYADFEYARTAIKLGVENYILKPVVPDELFKTLTSLIQQLDQEQNQKERLSIRQSFLLQHGLQQAISGTLDTFQADPYILEQIPAFQFMILLDFPGSFLENNYSSFYDTLRKDLFPGMESLNPAPGQALLFLRQSSDDLALLTRKLYRFIQNHFKTACYLAASFPLQQYSSLKEAFSALEQQMEQRFWVPDEPIFLPSHDPEPMPQPEQVDDNQQLGLIRQALSSVNPDKLQQSLDLLFAKYRLPANQSQIYVKFFFSSLLTTLYPYLPSQTPDGTPTPTLDELISSLYLQRNIENIIAQIQSCCDRIKETFAVTQTGVRKEVLMIEHYIAQNYGKDLSIEHLASVVYLTPDYLSRLFKKATGKSLSQYIRQFRMEKARELLLGSEKKVIQIGSEVGYPNYSYFCQSFREYFGNSPEKYRQENGQ